MSAKPSTRDEMLAVADLIDRFLDGSLDPDNPFEWDDFCTLRGSTPETEARRKEIEAIVDDFPRTHPREWCSPAGMQRLREIALAIRKEQG